MRFELSKVRFTHQAAIAALVLAGCARVLPVKDEAAPAADQGVELNTEISGLEADQGKVQRSVVELKFAVAGRDSLNQDFKPEGFECKFGKDEKYIPCNGTTFTISGLKDGGEYRLEVRGLVRQTSSQKILAAKEAAQEFKVDLSQGDQVPVVPGVGRTNALSQHLQVGALYQVDVPSGMHVTEYSTSKTTGVLSFYRVLPEADPFYLGNFSCTNGWDRVVASMTPAGAPLMYCHSTPTREAYKTENEFRLAHNHAEIATDTALVTDLAQERLVVSSFDQDFELLASRSRFMNTCGNRPIKFIEVPMIPDFFLGNNPQKVKFWYCDTIIPGMDGSPETWRVGAFYENDVIDWSDPAQSSKTSRGIEAVYMSRANASILVPEYFARHAQVRVLDVLKKVLP